MPRSRSQSRCLLFHPTRKQRATEHNDDGHTGHNDDHHKNGDGDGDDDGHNGDKRRPRQNDDHDKTTTTTMPTNGGGERRRCFTASRRACLQLRHAHSGAPRQVRVVPHGLPRFVEVFLKAKIPAVGFLPLGA